MKSCPSVGLPGEIGAGGLGDESAKALRRAYSVSTLSAHSTSPTKMTGVANVAFLPARSLSRTPRALAHAPQTWIGILCSTVFAMASDSGAQPTGTTDAATALRINVTASPSRKIWTE